MNELKSNDSWYNNKKKEKRAYWNNYLKIKGSNDERK